MRRADPKLAYDTSASKRMSGGVALKNRSIARTVDDIAVTSTSSHSDEVQPRSPPLVAIRGSSMSELLVHRNAGDDDDYADINEDGSMKRRGTSAIRKASGGGSSGGSSSRPSSPIPSPSIDKQHQQLLQQMQQPAASSSNKTKKSVTMTDIEQVVEYDATMSHELTEINSTQQLNADNKNNGSNGATGKRVKTKKKKAKKT